MALMEAILLFLIGFIFSYVLCSHNIIVAKYVCPASFATLLAILGYYMA